MQIGIVLAGGKGTRFKSKKTNKTIAEFHGKPLVKYGTDLLSKSCDKVVVVVGFNGQGVIKAVHDDPKILFAHQKVRLGTGHATRIGVQKMMEKAIRQMDYERAMELREQIKKLKNQLAP